MAQPFLNILLFTTWFAHAAQLINFIEIGRSGEIRV